MTRERIGDAKKVDDIMGISEKVETLWRDINLNPDDSLVVKGWKWKGAKGLEFFVSSLIPETPRGKRHDAINARRFPVPVTVEFIKQVIMSGVNVYLEDTEKKPPSWM